MVSFSFSLKKNKPKRETKPKNVIIYSNVLGLVIKDNECLRVLYKDILYVIDPTTISTKGRRVIYARIRDKYNHRIKIIRNADGRFDVGTKHYVRVTDGLYVIGNVITNSYGMTLFYIKRVVDYNEDIYEIRNDSKE